jgi:predicted protein tyrosine phosphatase
MLTYTEQIYSLSCPFDNKYQGLAARHLYVCSAGLLRSPTAAEVAISLGYNARSCGSATYALIPISVNLIHWANKIFFMEENNYHEALESFFGDTETCKMLETKAVVWEIEDYFDRNSPILKDRVLQLLSN